MSAVLVDSSCWNDFSGPIYADVLCGAPNREVYERIGRVLPALLWIDSPPDVWHRVADLRFAAGGLDVQAGLIDLLIAMSAAGSWKQISSA